MSNWSLRKIVIAGFRGYNGSQTVDLSAPFTLLEGPQGAGKSSTLTAVEWVLFGDEVAKKAIGIDERKDWEIRNRKAGATTVELVLSNRQEELRITRTDQNRKRGAAFSWELNGKQSRDEGKLRALLGISPKDYFSAVHLHQEVIRALLTEEPRSRRDMLDRLLGLSDLRNMLDGIKQARLAEALRAADQKYNGIEAQLNAILATKRTDVQNRKNAAAARGVASFSGNGSERLCFDVQTRLERFAQQCAATLTVLPSAATLPAQRSFSTSAKQALRTLRNEQPDLKRQQTLLQRQSQLQTLQAAYISEANAFRALENTRAQIELKVGNRAQVRARIDGELKPELNAVKKKRAELDKRAGVIEEAIQYFEAIRGAAEKPACPICEKEVSDVSHLHEHLDELREAFAKEIEPIQQKITSAESEIERLEGEIRQLDRLDSQIKRQAGKVGEAKMPIETALGRTIGDGEDPNSLINAVLVGIVTELGTIKDQVASSNKQLNEIDDAIQTVDEVLAVLTLESEIEQILKIKDSDEYKAVQQAKHDLEQLGADVELIQSSVGDTVRSAAKEKLDAAKKAIADNFRKLGSRTDFREIEIDPETYEILAVRDGEKISALSIFNQGDLNCAGVSVFLGLGAAPGVSHDLGFLILDDPSQSMDKAHKDRLVALFDSLPEDKQTIVSTSESDFAQTIMDRVVRKKKHYVFDMWSDAKGSQPELSPV
jgi:DNA repair exonuclease SbcCD ATPase subunit